MKEKADSTASSTYLGFPSVAITTATGSLDTDVERIARSQLLNVTAPSFLPRGKRPHDRLRSTASGAVGPTSAGSTGRTDGARVRFWRSTPVCATPTRSGGSGST